MKKALEILKHYKAKEVGACSSLYQYGECNYPIQHTSFSVKVYDEAIAELEEFMKPKTCDECEWWDFNSYGIFKKCFNGEGNCASTKSSFGCNRFKQKDNE